MRGIVRYQVYLGAQLVLVKKICQLTGLVICIVDPIQHYVLKSKPFSGLERPFKFFTGRKKFLQWPFFVDWHQLVAELIRRRGERDRQMGTIVIAASSRMRGTTPAVETVTRF